MVRVLDGDLILFLLTSNGPLAIAVIAWKNSLVFHDIDKITSLYIHIAPPLGKFKISGIATKSGSDPSRRSSISHRADLYISNEIIMVSYD
jgi:hypothetical protein